MHFLNKCSACSPSSSSSVSGSVVLPACSWPSTSACGLFLATGMRPLFSHANFPSALPMIAVLKAGGKTILIVWYTQVRKRDGDHTQSLTIAPGCCGTNVNSKFWVWALMKWWDGGNWMLNVLAFSDSNIFQECQRWEIPAWFVKNALVWIILGITDYPFKGINIPDCIYDEVK